MRLLAKLSYLLILRSAGHQLRRAICDLSSLSGALASASSRKHVVLTSEKWPDKGGTRNTETDYERLNYIIVSVPWKHFLFAYIKGFFNLFQKRDLSHQRFNYEECQWLKVVWKVMYFISWFGTFVKDN